MWADKAVSSVLQKISKFVNISISYSLSISLTTTMKLSQEDREVSTRQAQTTTNIRGVEGKRTYLQRQILLGIRCHGCTALLAVGMICTTRGSTPESWNEILGPWRSTGCIILLSSFQLNSKAGKKKEKKKFKLEKFSHSFMEEPILLKVWPSGSRAGMCVSAVL